MQTAIDPSLKQTHPLGTEISEAEEILRACVHCGFCTATCPTYQILGNELDSPRGRIYLIKELLEGNPASEKTRLHLDRCLTCRSCETTCPSGVRYSRLVDIGRRVIDQQLPRSNANQVLRKTMMRILPEEKYVGKLITLGHALRPLLPSSLSNKLPLKQVVSPRPTEQQQRRMLVLEGCVQPHATPNTNAAAARVLNRLGISLVSTPRAGCCGAIEQHMSDSEAAKQRMRNNIDAWWPQIEQGVEAIVITASGCGLMVKEYGEELRNDPTYAEKAARVSELARDIVEIVTQVLAHSPLPAELTHIGKGTRVAYQSSCTLQHGQKLSGHVEQILQRCGYTLTPVAGAHLCCGAAGTYTLLQRKLSEQLRHNKLAALEHGAPDLIATANVGCHMHLAGATQLPVKHWIELLDTPQGSDNSSPVGHA